MKHLSLEDIKIAKPDFENNKIPKGKAILLWLINWVKYSLECGIADIGDFIPTKDELAGFLNVSPATMQNSIRQAKNLGYFISKQSIGTSIADFYSKDIKSQDEICHSSLAECKIKKIIIDNKHRLNYPIPSITEFSRMTDFSQNTIRFVLENLTQQGYLEKVHSRGNKYNWIYKKELSLTQEEILNGINDEDFTLTHQLVKKIKSYIEKTYKQGDKILPNHTFSTMFDVSIKTINDAMKVLNAQKIILSRRGRYGTIYLGKNQNPKTSFITSDRKKTSLTTNYSYSWQKTLVHFKKYVQENCKTGDKIPTVRQLADILNVSPNTIRRALSDLFKEGYLISKRGKQGGIYIIDMPPVEEKNYKWLSINPDVVKF